MNDLDLGEYKNAKEQLINGLSYLMNYGFNHTGTKIVDTPPLIGDHLMLIYETLSKELSLNIYYDKSDKDSCAVISAFLDFSDGNYLNIKRYLEEHGLDEELLGFRNENKYAEEVFLNKFIALFEKLSATTLLKIFRQEEKIVSSVDWGGHK